MSLSSWPATPAELADTQGALASRTPPAWRPAQARRLLVGGCFCCFPRGVAGAGATGDAVWVGAVTVSEGEVVSSVVLRDAAGARYVAGQLALREGHLLEQVVGRLGIRPDVLLVNATGRDHPRRAGLALHLGAVLDLPTVGVTHRPLVAEGSWPADQPGAASPVRAAGVTVGAWVRTRAGRRPLVAHAAWRTDTDVAVEVVRLATGTYRTPVPLREARRLARRARAKARPAPA